MYTVPSFSICQWQKVATEDTDLSYSHLVRGVLPVSTEVLEDQFFKSQAELLEREKEIRTRKPKPKYVPPHDTHLFSHEGLEGCLLCDAYLDEDLHEECPMMVVPRYDWADDTE